MRNFYLESSPYYTGMDTKEYLRLKREKVLEVIEPICEIFEIEDYDYIAGDNKEFLVVEKQQIGCMGNSIGAIVLELINYIWLNSYAECRSLGKYEDDILRVLKSYWK